MNFDYGRRIVNVMTKSNDSHNVLANSVPDDIVEAMPPRERALHERNERITKLVRYAPWIGFAAGLFCHAGRTMSFVHLGFALGGMGLGWLLVYVYKLIAHRLTVTAVDQDLTFRAEQFGRSVGMKIDTVTIDESGAGLSRHFYYRQGSKIVVSSMTRTWLSSEEMDFILAAAITHPDIKERKAWDMWTVRALPYIIVLLLAPAIALPFIPHQMLRMYGPYLVFGGPAYILIIGGSLMGFLRWELRRNFGKTSKRIQDTVEGDRTALELTGNREAAIAALVKLSQSPSTLGPSMETGRLYISQTSLMLRINKLRLDTVTPTL